MEESPRQEVIGNLSDKVKEFRFHNWQVKAQKEYGELMDKYHEVEKALLKVTMQYQKEVGEPRRCLMQAGEMMKALNWQEVTEPPELVELYATLDHAIRSTCHTRVLPHV
jgi:hypothetical protein